MCVDIRDEASNALSWGEVHHYWEDTWEYGDWHFETSELYPNIIHINTHHNVYWDLGHTFLHEAAHRYGIWDEYQAQSWAEYCLLDA